MPRPRLGQGRTFETPPQEIINVSRALFEYLMMLHGILFGIGEGAVGILDLENINSGIFPPTHGAVTHSNLIRGSAVVSLDADDDATATSLTITEADPDAVYGAEEQALVQELKTDLNLLFAEYNTTVTKINTIADKVNEILVSLRAANLMAG